MPPPFPTALLPWFLESVTRSNRTSVLLVAELVEESAAKGLGLKKGQLELELKKRCKRLPKKDGNGWVIRGVSRTYEAPPLIYVASR